MNIKIEIRSLQLINVLTLMKSFMHFY